MIYVECTPDEILVRRLTGLARRRVIHELKGKYEVLKRLSAQRDRLAVVDEDPASIVPPYLDRMSLIEDLDVDGLRVFQDRSRRNRVVVLMPKLEDWLVAAAKAAGIKMAGYGLPDNPARLHRRINANLVKYERLLDALDEAASRRLAALRRVLN